MAINSACTIADVIRTDEGVHAFCGCGWAEEGFSSRVKALSAHREHRFPGPNPREVEAVGSGGVRPSPRARRSRHRRTDT